MAGHDSLYDREAETGAFARLLRGEEGIENAIERGLIHARSRIGNRQPHVGAGLQAGNFGGLRCSEGDGLEPNFHPPGPAMHGVGRVGAKVEHDLMDLRGIGADGAGLERLDDLDGRRRGGADQLECFGDRPGNIQRSELRVAFAGEREDLADQFLGALTGGANGGKLLADGRMFAE